MRKPFSSRARPFTRRSRIAHSFRPRLDSLEDRVVLSAVFDSVLTIGSDTASITPTDNAIDAAGNSYVTGILQRPMDFDPAAVHSDGSDILTPRGSSDA